MTGFGLAPPGTILVVGGPLRAWPRLPGYGAGVHELLVEALAPVWRDVRASGLRPLRLGVWEADVPGSASAMLRGRNGFGMGVMIMLDAPEAERVARVTDQVQEFVIEELWYDSPTNWPPCPRDPTTHPLRVEVRNGAATWVCPRDQGMVASVGSLPGRR